MGTGWMEVISNYAMQVIDDIRLREELAVDSALFYRRMSLYMEMAIPMLNRPPELLGYLSQGLEQPSYADSEWISTAESTQQETQVQTGCVGFTLFSCCIWTQEENGEASITPYTGAAYDSDTGAVTFPTQAQAGVTYLMDFYTDGQFAQTLTPTMKRLLGLAIGCVWDERFSRNWLTDQMKIRDKSFSTVSESNYMTATAAKKSGNRAALNDELLKYEQDCEYARQVNPGTRQLTFI